MPNYPIPDHNYQLLNKECPDYKIHGDLQYFDAWCNQLRFVLTGPVGYTLAKNSLKFQIIGHHNSKSTKLPVYFAELPWADIIFRGNYYNWVVSVKLKNRYVREQFRDLTEGLYPDAAVDHCCAEGFLEEHVYRKLDDLAADSFTVYIQNEYKLVTFFWILRKIYED